MPNETLTSEVLYSLLKNFLAQVQSGSQATKGYTQRKIAGFEVSAGFGKGQPARVPWFGFFAKGQEAQCGIYPVCLYYKQHDLFIIAYGVSQTKQPSIQWGQNVTSKTRIHDELQRRMIASSYGDTKNRTGTVYGNSFLKACFDNFSKLNDINDALLTDIYSNIYEIFNEYTDTLNHLHTANNAYASKRISNYDDDKNDVLQGFGAHSIASYPNGIKASDLEKMKNVFLKSFDCFKTFPSCEKYISDERKYKDELGSIFEEELLPLLMSSGESSAALIPAAIDKVLRMKLKTTGVSQNIIH